MIALAPTTTHTGPALPPSLARLAGRAPHPGVVPMESAPSGPPARVGHNSGAKKAYYPELLTAWFAHRKERASDYLTPKESAASDNRPALLLQAMVIGIAAIYRDGLLNPESSESAEERTRGAFFM